jgi:hypothetical protein
VARLTYAHGNCCRVTKSAEASLATKYNQFCKVSYENQSDAIKAHIDVDVIGIAGGNADMSIDKRKESLNKWCAENRERAEASKAVYEEVQEFYKDAVSAWSRCNELKSHQVQIEPKITPDAKTIDISLRYTGATTSGILYMGYDADGFTCSDYYPTEVGPKSVPKDKAVYIDRQAIKIHCKRDTAIKEEKNGTTFSKMKDGTVTIHTAGDDMQLFFAEEWIPSLPDQEAANLKVKIDELKSKLPPIGTIISFSGTATEAESQKQFGWWICDGRVVDDPKAINYVGKPTPNLTDRFLKASKTSNDTGGEKSFNIPDQTIKSYTTGKWGAAFHGDPFTHMQGAHSWSTDAAIESAGTFKGISVPTIPPYYTVIFLVRVK